MIYRKVMAGFRVHAERGTNADSQHFTDVLSRHDMTAVDASELVAYARNVITSSGYGVSLHDVIDATPPWATCIVEFPINGASCGVLFLAEPDGTYLAHPVVLDGRRVYVKWCSARLSFDDDGRPTLLGTLYMGRAIPSKQDESDRNYVTIIALLAFQFCNSLPKALAERPVPNPDRPRVMNGAQPDHFDYRVLAIAPVVEVLESMGKASVVGIGKAFHEVRGHYRHLRSGAKVPVRPHWRGDKRFGQIIKDYRLGRRE